MSSRLHRRATITAAAAVIAAGATAPARAASPTAVTSPPDTSLISDTYALLSGVINPNGIPTSYHFEYGPTTAYGTSTPDTSAGNGKAEVPVDYSLDELAPATTYHYQLVAFPDASTGSAYSAIGRVPGGDQTFTTSPALAVSFAKRPSGKVTKGKTKFVLTAVGPADDVATGKIKLTAKFRSTEKGKAKTRLIGNKPFRIKVGAVKAYKVSIGGAARKYLARNGSLKAKVTAGALTKTITLKG